MLRGKIEWLKKDQGVAGCYFIWGSQGSPPANWQLGSDLKEATEWANWTRRGEAPCAKGITHAKALVRELGEKEECKAVRVAVVKKGREMRHGKGGEKRDKAINRTTHPVTQWLLQVLNSTRPRSGPASQPARPWHLPSFFPSSLPSSHHPPCTVSTL